VQIMPPRPPFLPAGGRGKKRDDRKIGGKREERVRVVIFHHGTSPGRAAERGTPKKGGREKRELSLVAVLQGREETYRGEKKKESQKRPASFLSYLRHEEKKDGEKAGGEEKRQTPSHLHDQHQGEEKTGGGKVGESERFFLFLCCIGKEKGKTERERENLRRALCRRRIRGEKKLAKAKQNRETLPSGRLFSLFFPCTEKIKGNQRMGGKGGKEEWERGASLVSLSSLWYR